MNKLSIGITGSIGMGKTTVSNFINELGYPVWIADNCIENLYKFNNEGFNIFKKYYPNVIDKEKVSKEKIIYYLKNDKNFDKIIKNKIYPILEKKRKIFFESNESILIFFEIPLLYENNLQKNFDFIICVEVPYFIQKKRVLKRKNMDLKNFNFFRSKQLPIDIINKNSDFLILTNASKINVKKQIKRICDKILSYNNE